jgi:hypothetical protein
MITPYIQHTPLLAFLIFSACAVSALKANDATVISFSALFKRRTWVLDSSFKPTDYNKKGSVGTFFIAFVRKIKTTLLKTLTKDGIILQKSIINCQNNGNKTVFVSNIFHEKREIFIVILTASIYRYR